VIRATSLRSTRSLLAVAKRLRDELAPLRFARPVAHVYNPLVYAWRPHAEYLRRYGQGTDRVLLVGMNAGYFGMAQTGVPFGDVAMVREWLGIEARVDPAPATHPKRPIEGFDCHRREVSGQRLWGWARARSGTPKRFFARFFVVNYCPLCFLEASGANRTPDKLPAREREPLFVACDRALAAMAASVGARCAVGIGRFAEQRVERVLGATLRCTGAPHPSPANASSGHAFAVEIERALARLGVDAR
jgi:single-strand selective monofunctional uracil DNA glycosylase